MKKIKENYPMYFMIFIIFQPILDLLTSLSINISNTSMTPGIIIRMLVLILGMYYMYSNRGRYLDKRIFMYVIIYSVFLMVNIIINYIWKDSFYLVRELTAIAKTSYFLLIFLISIISFREIQEKRTGNIFPCNISIAMFIVNISILLATFTGTGIRSYGALYKIGHSGWFYAANDIGVILALSLPILMWITFVTENKNWLIFNWMNILLTMLSLFTIGTKVGHLAVIITLIIAIISYVYEIIANKNNDQLTKVNSIITVIFFMFTLFATPYLPAYTNSSGQIATLIEQGSGSKNNGNVDEEDEVSISDEEDIFGESSTSRSEIVNGVVYSGRSGFLSLHQEFFKKAPIVQKLFGMGYAGNYEKSPEVIERDFHDIFYQFGIIGSILFFAPFMYYGIRELAYMSNNIRKTIGLKSIMLYTSIALGLGIGFMAGHTLTSPSVSVYLALVLGYTVVDVEYKSRLNIGI